jgi:hypothetical protein
MDLAMRDQLHELVTAVLERERYWTSEGVDTLQFRDRDKFRAMARASGDVARDVVAILQRDT